MKELLRVSMFNRFKFLKNPFRGPQSNDKNTKHYIVLERNIIIVMLMISVLPLGIMIFISNIKYKTYLVNDAVSPLISMANKTTHSFELFFEQRLSTMRFISTAYTFEQLSKEKEMSKILVLLKKEFKGFVDIGLINSKGTLISYAGPYSLLGKNYSDQNSFQETVIKNKYISNVFLGHRKFPHIVIAVQRLMADGQSWILRATIDIEFFDTLIDSMGFSIDSDIFLVNSEGVLQSHSSNYGKALEKTPLPIKNGRFKSNIIETTIKGREVIVVTSGVSIADYILVIVQPKIVALKSWHQLKFDLMILLTISLGVIILMVIKMSAMLVERIRESDERRRLMFTELQHTQKLSSIGRLAAGVAHEINNPLAIINEKAGLMEDLISFSDDFPNKGKFTGLTKSILSSVERCRKITHRLLGFSKRIDVKIELINVNNIIHEVLEFMEKDALFRKIDIRLTLDKELKSIMSDQSQIQQVILNLLTNAFAAIEYGGVVEIQTKNESASNVMFKVIDNGCGIPEEIIDNIFDPFFTTKEKEGTGLGLSITYGIINKLGGQITVESEVGKGTTFKVVLPLEVKLEKE